MLLLLGILLLLAPCSGLRRLCEVSAPGERCFHFETRPADFEDAESRCNRLGGDLASIHDATENRIVAQEARYLAQAAKHDIFWLGGKRAWFRWTWTDGSDFDYANFASWWDKTLPWNNCFAMVGSKSYDTQGQWVATKCSDEAPFVCVITRKAPKTTTPAPTTTTTKPSTTTIPITTTSTTTKKPTTTVLPTTTSTAEVAVATTTEVITTTTAEPCAGQTHPCRDGFLYIVNHKRLSWNRAEAHCRSLNGHLTSILSGAETDFVAAAIIRANVQFIKLGFDIWIGALHASWMDGSPWNYTNFYQYQPNDVAGNDCLQIFDANYKKWVNYACNREFPSICKVKVGAESE